MTMFYVFIFVSTFLVEAWMAVTAYKEYKKFVSNGNSVLNIYALVGSYFVNGLLFSALAYTALSSEVPMRISLFAFLWSFFSIGLYELTSRRER